MNLAHSNRSGNELYLAIILAVLVHAAVLLFYSANLRHSVTRLPFKVVNIKLGGEVNVTTGGGNIIENNHEVEMASAASENNTGEPQPAPATVEQSGLLPQSEVEKIEEGIRASKSPKAFPPDVSKKATKLAPVKSADAGSSLKETANRENIGGHSASAISNNPGQAAGSIDVGPEGAAHVLPNDAALNQAKEVTIRYEQALSLWMMKQQGFLDIAKNQGIGGEAVIRLQINREGAILHYGVEKKTGSPMLDNAILSMLQNIRNVPKVPEGYPGGKVLEFLIPIRFKLKP